MILKKIYLAIGFNLLLSFLYFKQLFFVGQESMFFDNNKILLTPFLLCYNFLGVIFYLVIQELIQRKRIKNKFELGSYFFLISIVLFFILFAFTFMTFEKGYSLTIPFILNFIEPIKMKFFFKQSIKTITIKNLVLIIVSFFLLIVSGYFSKFITANVNSWALLMGGFYFIILSYFDYYFYKRNNKI